MTTDADGYVHPHDCRCKACAPPSRQVAPVVDGPGWSAPVVTGSQVETDHLMSVTEANARGVSGVARLAEQGQPTVLMRGSKPVAAVLPMEAYYAWLEKHPGDFG